MLHRASRWPPPEAVWYPIGRPEGNPRARGPETTTSRPSPPVVIFTEKLYDIDSSSGGAMGAWFDPDFIVEHWMISSLVALGLVLVAVFIHDVLQTRHTIIHNFPVVGHLRFLLEMIGPELRQYWVANDKEEMPFNRQERRWVYATSKGQNSNFGFGTTEQVYSIGFPIIKHSTFPYKAPDSEDPSDVPCLA
jgi:hypothetical protein